MIDATAVRFLFFTLAAWLHQRDADAIAYLLEENRTLRAQSSDTVKLANNQLTDPQYVGLVPVANTSC